MNALFGLLRQFPQWWQRHFARPTELRKVATNALWLTGGYVLRLTIGVLVGAWVARYLGTVQYGALLFAAAFTSLFTPLIGLGLERVVVREVVRDPAQRDAVLGTAFALKLAAGIAAVPLIVVMASLIRPGEPVITWLVLLAATGQVCLAFDAIDYWFQSQVRSKRTVQVRNLMFVLVTAARIVAVWQQAPLMVFAVIGLAESAAYAVGMVIVYRRSGQQPAAWRATTPCARALLRDSWPLMLEGLAIMIYMRLDQTLLAAMLPGEAGTHAIGVYGVAVRLSEIWFFIPVAITNSLFPAIVQSRQASETLYRARLQRFFNFMALLSYAIAIPATFLSGFVVETIYGPEYREAGPMLAILVWAGLWVSLGLARNAALQAENRVIFSLRTSVLGAAINTGLNLLLIPSLQGLGAALATLISQAISAYAGVFLFRALRPYGRMMTRALLFPNPFHVPGSGPPTKGTLP